MALHQNIIYDSIDHCNNLFFFCDNEAEGQISETLFIPVVVKMDYMGIS